MKIQQRERQMITEAKLAKIDTTAESYRRFAELMKAGGWSLEAIRHGWRDSQGGCPGCSYCETEKAHFENCTGCEYC
ncbi:hypothetical protein ACWDTQ_28315 [Streptomyces cellulosae]